MGFLWSAPQQDTTNRDLMQQEADEARARETARKFQIALGMEDIDKQFSGFNDAFYNQRKEGLLNYFQPQLDDQLKKTREALTYAFSRAGTLNSSMAGQRTADLTKQYDLEKASLVSQAEGDAANLRNSVQNQKSTLIGQLNASADANASANSTLASTQQIYAQRPTFSPLGNLFAGAAQGIGNFIGANQNATNLNTYFGGKGSSATRTVK
jgi:hypothetical protein